MHPAGHTQPDPFLILHNYRTAPQPQPKARRIKRPRNHYLTLLPQCPVMTRRMAAELQHPKQQLQKQCQTEVTPDCIDQEGQQSSREDVNFFDDKDLDRGIPFDELPQEDIEYHLKDLTLSSSYSKLEKTLYGVGTSAYSQDLSDGEMREFEA